MKGDSRGMAAEVRRAAGKRDEAKLPGPPSDDEIRRMRAESMVREMFEKTPEFEQHVKRAMAEMKAMERGMATRMGGNGRR